MDPLISIIVPAYNSGKYIERCIKSLLQQTYYKLEIIIIDDGSEDNTSAVCQNLVKQDERIKYFYQDNKGVSSARNLGLKKCHGSYIIFVDSDDWILPETIFELVKLISSHKDVNVIMYSISNKKSPQKDKASKAFFGKENVIKIIPKLIINESINSCCNKLYKLEVIKNNKISFDERIKIGEDALFNYSLFFFIKSLVIIEKCFYVYTKENNKSLTSREYSLKFQDLFYINKCLIDTIKLQKDNKTQLLISAYLIRIKYYIQFFRFRKFSYKLGGEK